MSKIRIITLNSRDVERVEVMLSPVSDAYQMLHKWLLLFITIKQMRAGSTLALAGKMGSMGRLPGESGWVGLRAGCPRRRRMDVQARPLDAQGLGRRSRMVS